MYCLSSAIRNDTLLEKEHRVSKHCRAQLRVELLALEDTIQMDPEFKKQCQTDIDDKCAHVKAHRNEVSYFMRTIENVRHTDSAPKVIYFFLYIKYGNRSLIVVDNIFNQFPVCAVLSS